MVKFYIDLFLTNISFESCHPFLNEITQSHKKINRSSSFKDITTVEEILGNLYSNFINVFLPPVFDVISCDYDYTLNKNQIPLNIVNPKLTALKGKSLYDVKLSSLPEYNHIDGGDDNILNHILGYAAKNKQPYPARLVGKNEDDKHNN